MLILPRAAGLERAGCRVVAGWGAAAASCKSIVDHRYIKKRKTKEPKKDINNQLPLVVPSRRYISIIMTENEISPR
jgi:hypothetical protein